YDVRAASVCAALRRGDAKVQEADAAVIGDQQVLWRDIAVHDAQRAALAVDRFVNRVQALASLGQHVGAEDRQASTRLGMLVEGLQDVGEVLSAHVLHGQVESALGLPEVE